MLKRDEEVFLDDLTLQDVSKSLNIEVVPSKVEGKSIIDIIKK